MNKEVKELNSDTVQGINKALKTAMKKGWRRASATKLTTGTGYHVLVYKEIIDESND